MDNRSAMLAEIDRIQAIYQRQRDAEAEGHARAASRGKLLPRARLAALLDPGSDFLELWALAGYQMYGDQDGSTAGGNLITGIGQVAGRQCLVMVWNHVVAGGTMNAVTTRKVLALQRLAFRLKLPVVSLSESGGADLAQMTAPDPWGALDFLEGGRMFCQQAELSAAGIPQITVAHGNATAGGAYQVALSDYIILVRGQSQLFLAGPPLLRAATGEVADHETLGGAEMHTYISGTGEYLAEDDDEAIQMARNIVSQLPEGPPTLARDIVPHDQSALLDIVGTDPRIPFDMTEVIRVLADPDSWLPFSPEADRGTLCGHVRLGGIRCGVIGNNGPITPRGALKAAQFIQLCDQAGLPVVFLQNTTGFMVGVEVEQAGQVKHGARLIQAVANMRTPKISIILANAYGAGNYAMASKALKPDFVFAWPTARQAVMGGEQAARVIEIVSRARYEKTGRDIPPAVEEKILASTRPIVERLNSMAQALYCTARLMDDGIIDPRDTRKVLVSCLDLCLGAGQRICRPATYGTPRP
jgi:geranyl-CoA carboxylase beta subunit